MRRSVPVVTALLLAMPLCALPAQGGSAGEACLVEQHADAASKGRAEARWWLLRQGTRVETRSEDGQTGELWTRLPGGELRYARLDHVERVAIEHVAGDLAVAGVARDSLWFWTEPLPEQVESSAAGRPVWLRLRDCGPLGKAGVGMTPAAVLESYRYVDFIDLGDMESDEQLRRVGARLRGG